MDCRPSSFTRSRTRPAVGDQHAHGETTHDRRPDSGGPGRRCPPRPGDRARTCCYMQSDSARKNAAEYGTRALPQTS